MFQSPSGNCLSHNIHGNIFSWGEGVAFDLPCFPNNDNLWKNAHGQVYNKDGRALWWNGEYGIHFFIVLFSNVSYF